jgi:hypothetical protein
MGKVTRIFRGGRVKPISPEKVEELIKAGASPSHPAFSRAQRDNVVELKKKKK